jgi:hypothetical protein
VFLLNSRYSLLCALAYVIITLQDSLSRSYEVILPSSFNIIILITLVFSTNPPVYSLGYGLTNKAMKRYEAYFQNVQCTYKNYRYVQIQYKTLDAPIG